LDYIAAPSRHASGVIGYEGNLGMVIGIILFEGAAVPAAASIAAYRPVEYPYAHVPRYDAAQPAEDAAIEIIPIFRGAGVQEQLIDMVPGKIGHWRILVSGSSADRPAKLNSSIQRLAGLVNSII